MYRSRSMLWVTSSSSSTSYQPLLPDTNGYIHHCCKGINIQKAPATISQRKLFHTVDLQSVFSIIQFSFFLRKKREREHKREHTKYRISNHGDSWSHIQDRLSTLYVTLLYSRDEVRLHWLQHQYYDMSWFLQDQAFSTRPTKLIIYLRKWELSK